VGDDVTREGVAARRILCVPNFVDEGAFTDLPLPFKLRLRADLGIPREAQIIGCVARLAAVKDHATLLRAMQPVCQRRPTAHLVLVGGGETREQLEALASTLGISDRVHFAGMQPNEPNLHHLFDISTLTSVGEGFPNTLVEAMAAGRPVVATRVGGNVDAVRPDTGILVEARNPEQLTRAFETLLADTALRRRLGQAAQQRARREYHSNSIIPRIEQTYTRLAGLAV
jgi:glycosyltransferase involved in cell wall biosynthesis